MQNYKNIIFVFTFLFLFGCDILSTRDSEEPNTSRNNFTVASTPEILFSNLKNSLKEKVVENYMSCFVDESFSNQQFRFIPAASSISKFSNLSIWDLESERQYFNNLKASTSENIPIILELLNENRITGIDSSTFQFDYNLIISSENESLSGNYSGSLQFVIHRDSRNQWVITNWTDIEVSEKSSWSELKGRYY